MSKLHPMTFGSTARAVAPIGFNQNSLVALLKGPDTVYKDLLKKSKEKPDQLITNDQCGDKNSFLQVHVRPLTTKQQKRLLKKQLRGHRSQSISKKNRGVHLTFPISYSCPVKYRKTRASPTFSTASLLSSPTFKRLLAKETSSQSSNQSNRSKSAVSISFIDEKSADKSVDQKYPSSILSIPAKTSIRSSNASPARQSCSRCSSTLSNGVCSCIVQRLLQLSNRQYNGIRVELRDIFENLTSNNIIT